MAKRLIISRLAYLDIEKIVEFNNNRNKSDTYSKRLIRELYLKFHQLIKNPFIGIKTAHPSILLLIWDQFYIFYRVNESTISILSIHHQKENIDI